MVALVAAGGASAHLRAPVRVTLDGVAGVRPGMFVFDVSARWSVSLRPSYEVSSTCGPADIRRVAGVEGYAVFMPTREPNRFDPQGAYYFVRRTAAPHWELRFDFDAQKRVRRIAFGTRDAVRLDEACA